MKLSIIIPAHNEEKTIAEILQKLASVDLDLWDKEIIVVDDGSTDATSKIVDQEKTKFDGRQILFLRHNGNLGKGAAIKTGLGAASGDYVIIQDADLEYFPEDIPKLLSAISNNNPVVFGDRGIKRYPERGFHYVIATKLLSWAVNLFFGAHLSDLYTGYKLIPLNLIKSFNLESTGFEFEAEVTCKILKAGYKIKEVPISYQPRTKQQGKHIRFKDALKGFWTIVKFRLK